MICAALAILALIVAYVAAEAWREDCRDQAAQDRNTFEVRIVLTSPHPVRAVVQNYPDHASFRDELFWHIEDRQILRFEAFPLSRKALHKLREQGVHL